MGIIRSRAIARLLATLALFVCTFSHAAIPPSERAVLDAIYTQTNGANWKNHAGWEGAAGTECTWAGVVCDANQTHVEQVILSAPDQNFVPHGNNLVGTLPSISALTQLQAFDVSANQLSGPLPLLAGLTNLSMFFAKQNQFTGNIPPLAGLTNLQRFAVGTNQLSGSIPSLSGLSALLIFGVDNNRLTGPIPVLSGLNNLQVFQAHNNQLNGTLPQLTGLSSLTEFRVFGNQLTGNIPSLAGLTNMTYFGVGINQLTGTNPSLAGLTSLQTFNTYTNRLTGPIPSLQGLPNLVQINVSDNQLTGTIPDLSGHPNFNHINLAHNQLTGQIPALSAFTKLDGFSVSANQLTGPLPDLTGLTNLEDFEADANQLTGNIPSLSTNTILFYFDVAGNRLTGTIPSLGGLNALQYFFVGNNGLSGDIPTAPASLLAKQSSLCNNALNQKIDTAWDAATGVTPWYSTCSTSPSVLTLTTADTTVATGTSTTITATITTSLSAMSTAKALIADVAGPSMGTVTVTDDQGKLICYIVIVNNTGSCNVVLPGGATTNLAGGYSGATSIAPASASISKATPVATPGNLDQHGWTGAWYNLATGGQGIVFEIYPDLNAIGDGAFGGGWFTYDTSSGAEDKKRWYTLQGHAYSNSPATTLDIIAPTGGNFNAGPVINSGNGQSYVGHASLNFTDCTHASLSYSFTDGSSRVGNIPLTRGDANVTCAATNGNGNGTTPGTFLLSGAWYSPSTSGQGILFDINPVQNIIFAAWYTYAPNGQAIGGGASQRWYSLQVASANVGATTLSNISIYSPQGGVFDSPGGVTTSQVGTASMVFTSCNAMTLTYAFTSGTNSGQSGTINLQRVGPTPAGCNL